MSDSAGNNSSLQPPHSSSSPSVRSRSTSTARRDNLSEAAAETSPQLQHRDNPAISSASVANPSAGNEALSAEVPNYSDNPRTPRHLLDTTERGRVSSRYQDHQRYEDFPHQPSRVLRQSRTSSLAHTHSRQLGEEAYYEEKSWQNNSPTLTQQSSPRGSFEEGPKFFTYYQGRYHPMNIETEKAFPSPPVGAAASAYPRGAAPVPAVPLINSIKNEWQRSVSSTRRKSDDMYGERERPHVGAYIRRAFRRRGCLFILAFFTFMVLLTKFMGPSVGDRSRLQESLLSRLSEEKGYFGVNQRVGFTNMNQVAEMERWMVPGSGESKDGQAASDRRLIIVGDIHGCIDERKLSQIALL